MKLIVPARLTRSRSERDAAGPVQHPYHGDKSYASTNYANLTRTRPERLRRSGASAAPQACTVEYRDDASPGSPLTRSRRLESMRSAPLGCARRKRTQERSSPSSARIDPLPPRGMLHEAEQRDLINAQVALSRQRVHAFRRCPFSRSSELLRPSRAFTKNTLSAGSFAITVPITSCTCAVMQCQPSSCAFRERSSRSCPNQTTFQERAARRSHGKCSTHRTAPNPAG